MRPEIVQVGDTMIIFLVFGGTSKLILITAMLASIPGAAAVAQSLRCFTALVEPLVLFLESTCN